MSRRSNKQNTHLKWLTYPLPKAPILLLNFQPSRTMDGYCDTIFKKVVPTTITMNREQWALWTYALRPCKFIRVILVNISEKKSF